jgi:hypothetical protein
LTSYLISQMSKIYPVTHSLPRSPRKLDSPHKNSTTSNTSCHLQDSSSSCLKTKPSSSHQSTKNHSSPPTLNESFPHISNHSRNFISLLPHTTSLFTTPPSRRIRSRSSKCSLTPPLNHSTLISPSPLTPPNTPASLPRTPAPPNSSLLSNPSSPSPIDIPQPQTPPPFTLKLFPNTPSPPPHNPPPPNNFTHPFQVSLAFSAQKRLDYWYPQSSSNLTLCLSPSSEVITPKNSKQRKRRREESVEVLLGLCRKLGKLEQEFHAKRMKEIEECQEKLHRKPNRTPYQ